MRKRAARRRKTEFEKEEFQAYGEYTYDYLHQIAPERQAEDWDGGELPPAVSAPVEVVKRTHRRRRTHAFFKLLALLAALTIVLVVLQETVFRLQTVYVIGNRNLTPQQVVMASGLVKGRNIFSISEEDVRKAISKNHTIIFQGMQKEYPSTVYLYIEERQTVAVMRWLGIQYTLDAEGIVMTEENTMSLPDGLPVVTGFRVSAVNTGQPLAVRSEKQLQAYRAIISELGLQLYMDQITEINLSNPDNIYLVTAEGVTVRLGDSNYMQAKIGAIRTDMAYLRQLGKTSGILDVTIPEDAKYMPET